MFDVIALGSATKDIFLGAEKLKRGKGFYFPLGGKFEVKNVRSFSGGGGVNTASTFVRQGLRTAFCGAVGEDPMGEEIIKELGELGVATDLIKIKKGESTDLGLIFHAHDERTIILNHGLSRALDERDIDWAKLKTKWIYLAPLWGKAARLTKKLISFAKANKIQLAINPSLDQLSLPGIKELLKKVDVLILNGEEASFLTKIKPFQEKKVFSKVASLTTALIVITRGRQGATAFDEKFIYRMGAPKVRVVDATGAGDSFGSGLVSGLIQKKNIEESLRLAMSNAIANIQVVGANQGLLRKNPLLLKIKARKTKWSA